MAFQDWNLPDKIVFHWRIGTPLPNAYAFTAHIRDIIGLDDSNAYNDFELRIKQFRTWFNLFGDFKTFKSELVPNATIINSKPIIGNCSIALNFGVDTLGLTDNFGTLRFEISGKPISGSNAGIRQILHTKEINIILKIYDRNQPILVPDKVEFNYEYNSSVVPEYQTINVDALGGWELYLHASADNYEVNLISGIIRSKIINNGAIKIRQIAGYNSAKFEIKPSLYLLSSLPIGKISNEIFYNPEIDWVARPLVMDVNINPSFAITASKDKVSFYAIKGIQEALPEIIEINSNYDFTIDYPDWVFVTPEVGLSGKTLISIAVKTSDLIPAGNYNDIIKIKYTRNSEINVFEISISYLVDEFISLPYSTSEFNYTLENKTIDFFSNLQNTFFELILSIKAYDFYTGESNTFIIPLKIILLRNRQKENIGLKIHRVMKRIKEIDLTQKNQYKTCEVDMTVREIDLDTRQIKREFSLENLKFIAGVKPQLSNGMGILSLYRGVTHSYPKSKHYVNLLLNSGNNLISIIKNSQTILTYSINGSEYNVVRDEIDFEFLEAKPGDTFTYKLHTTNSDFLIKEFFIFPEPINSFRILWEDEFKLISDFYFTGEFNLKTDFERKDFKRHINFVEIIENISTKKEIRLIINTGFILKTEIVLIESLLKSSKAWLLTKDNQTIQIIPQTKSITSIDSSRELNAFDLEFIINRSSNEEIYTL